MKICYVKHYMRVRSLGVVYLGGSGSGSLMESYSSSCPGQHSSEGITTICGKFLKMGITDHLTSAWKTCMQVKKQQLEPDIEQQTSSKLGKESVKTILSPCLFMGLKLESWSCFVLAALGLLCAGFPQLLRAGAPPLRGARASHCDGFFCEAQLSSCGSRALEHGLSSCGVWA